MHRLILGCQQNGFISSNSTSLQGSTSSSHWSTRVNQWAHWSTRVDQDTIVYQYHSRTQRRCIVPAHYTHLVIQFRPIRAPGCEALPPSRNARGARAVGGRGASSEKTTRGAQIESTLMSFSQSTFETGCFQSQGQLEPAQPSTRFFISAIEESIPAPNATL